MPFLLLVILPPLVLLTFFYQYYIHYYYYYCFCFCFYFYFYLFSYYYYYSSSSCCCCCRRCHYLHYHNYQYYIVLIFLLPPYQGEAWAEVAQGQYPQVEESNLLTIGAGRVCVIAPLCSGMLVSRLGYPACPCLTILNCCISSLVLRSTNKSLYSSTRGQPNTSSNIFTPKIKSVTHQTKTLFSALSNPQAPFPYVCTQA